MTATPADPADHAEALPVLYSFRRCPYAMRARMAIVASAQRCELREVILRDKPAELLAASPKATVPVLVAIDGTVLDESLDIMHWALHRSDPHALLMPQTGDAQDMATLVSRIDGPFKHHLDRYKYAPRRADENDGAGVDPQFHRDAARKVLVDFDARLGTTQFLFGSRISLADIAVAPFVRQFANTDIEWFARLPLPYLQAWLADILASELFTASMRKYPQWQSGTPGVPFPEIQRVTAPTEPETRHHAAHPRC